MGKNQQLVFAYLMPLEMKAIEEQIRKTWHYKFPFVSYLLINFNIIMWLKYLSSNSLLASTHLSRRSVGEILIGAKFPFG